MPPIDIFAASADILAKCQAVEDDLSAIFDPETGYAPQFAQLCRDQIQNSTVHFDDEHSIPDLWETLQLEANTWDLLQILLSARKTEAQLPPSARDLLKRNPYTPTATLAQSILEHSRLLNELVSVREWLHDCAPAPIVPEATTGYWKITKHKLLQALRTGNKRELDPLVTELDPDAPNRKERNDDGKGLASDDTNYEKALAQSLYSFVRAGRLDEAIELCRRSHRPWRAASIRGSLLFRWRALADVPPPEELEDSTFDDGWGGNKRRRLWKSTCTRAALNTLMSDADRTLYAALAPSPATSVVLKSACRTWEDHLWAQVCIICEQKQMEALARAGGGFWDGGVEAISNSMAVDVEEEREEKEWEVETVKTLEGLASVAVEEGSSASDPFHVSQLHIILNRTDKLLNDFASGLGTGEFNPDQLNYPTLTRFFAHLCLFLQMVDLPVPHDAMQIILEVYLQVLEEAGQRQHIAMYVSALGANAIDRYATYLTSLGSTSTIEERRQALKLAENNGLNIIEVAQATAEKTMETAFETLPHLKVALPPVDTRETPLTDDEWFLVRSIEWTTFMEATYPQALEQANAVFRYFLGSGKLHAARTLLHMLPQDLRSLQDNREHATEFLYYTKLFAIFDLLDRVSEAQSAEVLHTTKGAKTAWVNNLKSLVNEVREKVTLLLTTDWLQHDIGAASGAEYRQGILLRLRRIYIPELVIRLHSLLVNTSDKIDGNIKNALELANVVADSRYSLYDDFLEGNSNRLKDYLLAIRQAVLKGLEGGGSNPFWLMRT